MPIRRTPITVSTQVLSDGMRRMLARGGNDSGLGEFYRESQ
jgi:hypothetical protein